MRHRIRAFGALERRLRPDSRREWSALPGFARLGGQLGTRPRTTVAIVAKSSVNESAVVAGVVEQMPIPTDATTSRVLVNNDLLRVVAFVMDAGQELTEHASARAVTVQVTDGELSFTINGENHELTAGDLVYMAPDARHALVATTPCRFVLVMVDVAPLDSARGAD